MYKHSPELPPFTYILELTRSSQQRPSWLSWQSVTLDSRDREGLGVAFFATALGLHTRKKA